MHLSEAINIEVYSVKRVYYKGLDFWRVEPKYKDREYPINDEVFKRTEKILNIKFPDSFIGLMKKQNGGELNYPHFILPAGDTDSIPYGELVTLPSIEPIHFENDDISILSSKELLREVDIPDERLIVLWTDFHYWVVLDYRQTKDNPSVMLIAENFADSSNGTTVWEYIKLAETFGEFLKKLFR